MSATYAEVIGDPIAHSKSPTIHNFWLKKLEIDADYRAHHVTPDGLAGYLNSRRDDARWRGCNVTMPHKIEVMPLLDVLDPLARQIGAVNTIVRQPDGSLLGMNTDADGFLEPLAGQLSQQHLFRMARILGTGGAARAIVAALAPHHFTIVLAGRNPAKARAILDELMQGGEHHEVEIAHFSEPTDFIFDNREGCLDLVINASPLGMCGQEELAFDWSHAPPGAIAYDIVTDPLDTDFLKNARAAGHGVLDGYHMLIGQAANAFERFFGAPPPREHDAELRELLIQ